MVKKEVAKQKEGSRLLLFYGTECSHCHDMDPLVARLEKETKLKVTRLEVWHDSKNAEVLANADKGVCGGVPFFYNEKSKKHLCGAVPYATLKAWALGK